MGTADYVIREISPADNPAVKSIVQEVILEMGAPKVGTAYEDKALDGMYEVYQKERSAYFVIEYRGKIVGGAGIAQLDNYKGNTCELQKMYFLPEARGKGLGSKMIAICLEKAKAFGFDLCYLETMPYMTDARKLYKKNGFKEIDGPMGNTCHYSCDVWMTKEL